MRRLVVFGVTVGLMTLGCGTTTETHVIPSTDNGNTNADTSVQDTGNPDEGSPPPTSDLSDCLLSQSIQNPGGKLHSQPCENGAECLYGLCHSSPAVATFKFCTKNPYCGPGTECGSDSVEGGLTFKAQLFNKNSYPNETAMEICTQTCMSVDDCPPGYTGCATVTGVVKTCVAE